MSERPRRDGRNIGFAGSLTVAVLIQYRLSQQHFCRHEPICEKHPDLRVQRAVEKVFQEFEDSPSVSQLHRRLLKAKFQLPVVPPGKDWREVEWVWPGYRHLLDMLRHPIYAGTYVRGRSKTFTVLNDEGHAQKKRRRVPMAEWEIVMEDHHEPYISKESWERNVEKIAANANMGGMTNSRSPQHGSGLMVGLLRCRRCGHKLYAAYRDGAIGYQCRRGTNQRDASGWVCFTFRATRSGVGRSLGHGRNGANPPSSLR